MNTLLLIGLFLVTWLAFNTVAVWLAARLGKLPKRGWDRAALIVVIRFFVVAGLSTALAISFESAFSFIGLWTLALMTDAVCSAVLFWWILGGELPTLFGAWSGQLILGMTGTILLTIAFGAFVDPMEGKRDGMSPNIRGWHIVELTPSGDHLIIDSVGPDGMIASHDAAGAVVVESREFRWETLSRNYTAKPDRILCNKTKMPQRWSATVYCLEQDRSHIGIQRLVGLPGERVEIRDGTIWVNGERLTTPSQLGPIKYTYGNPIHGVYSEPFEISLGEDEYFLLNDIPEMDWDGRRRGATKRPQILGVADVIYWPPSRWRLNP
jgi:signal peptidase I